MMPVILTYIPVWVFLVALVLIAGGVRALSDRPVSWLVFLAPAVLLAWGTRALSGATAPYPAAAWIVGAAIGGVAIWLMSKMDPRVFPSGGSLMLRGSRAPLIRNAFLFVMKFATTYATIAEPSAWSFAVDTLASGIAAGSSAAYLVLVIGGIQRARRDPENVPPPNAEREQV